VEDRKLIPYLKIQEFGVTLFKAKYFLKMKDSNGLSQVLKKIGGRYYFFEEELLEWLKPYKQIEKQKSP
jgi:hypothetical protein